MTTIIPEIELTDPFGREIADDSRCGRCRFQSRCSNGLMYCLIYERHLTSGLRLAECLADEKLDGEDILEDKPHHDVGHGRAARTARNKRSS